MIPIVAKLIGVALSRAQQMTLGTHLRSWPVWAFLLLLLGSSEPAQAGSIGEIRIYEVFCVQGNGRGRTVTLEKCDGEEHQKWFFAASRHTIEVFQSFELAKPFLGAARHVLRNGEWPHLCLDVNQESTENGTPTILWPCHGRSNQQWVKDAIGAVTGSGWLQSGNGKCLNVAQHAKNSGTWLIIWDCIIAADNEIFTYGDIDFINNLQAAKQGFAAFKACEEDSDHCMLEPKRLVGDPPNLIYGFHTGAGWGGGRDMTLDFGDTYSLDKCSQAHDKWCWVPEGSENGEAQNLGHYIGCLEKTLPGSSHDLQAYVDALNFSRMLKVMKGTRVLDGTLPCAD